MPYANPDGYRQWRAANGPRIRALKRAYGARRGAFLAWLKGVDCADCGKAFHPCAMQFDHRDGTEKRFDVAQWAHGSGNLDDLQDEVQRCDLVCSNCHSLRTHLRRRRTVACLR